MYDQDDMYGEFRQRNPMASASIALGIASLLSCPTFYIAIPCGALAILCAILSRGKYRLSGRGKAGIICGIIGMILSAVITVVAVHTVLNNAEMKTRLEQTLQLYLRDSSFSLDEALDSLFPALTGSGNTGTIPAADETEEETEKRVRLRIAEDTKDTEAIPENNATDTTDTPATTDQIAETELRQDTFGTEEETTEKTPVVIPEGGGSFI